MPLTYFQPSQVDSTFNGYLRNRIINGAMMIDQRNAGASVNITGASAYPVDRWFAINSTDGTMTGQQSTVVPASGYKNSIVLTTGTADSSLAATQFAVVGQFIEGLNVSDFNWGSATASTVTLSFWVRSSLTGTFGGSIRNSAADRSYLFSYTIVSANTWEQKFITIPGDTTGTWLTTNGIGIAVLFALGTGSTYSGTANAWSAGNYIAPTGATSVIGTAGATFYLTGVQLEDGAVATPFERRMYGQELALCQRYYQQSAFTLYGPGGQTSGLAGQWISWPVYMRAAPTVAAVSPSYTNASGLGMFNASVSGFSPAFTVTGSNSTVTSSYTASIEL